MTVSVLPSAYSNKYLSGWLLRTKLTVTDVIIFGKEYCCMTIKAEKFLDTAALINKCALSSYLKHL